MSIEGDKTSSPPPVVPPERPPRPGEPEDEATTIWGKADLFEGAGDDEESSADEDEPLFREAPLSEASAVDAADWSSDQYRITGPIRLPEFIPEDEQIHVPEDEHADLAHPASRGYVDEHPADDGQATVEMSAAEAAALRQAALADLPAGEIPHHPPAPDPDHSRTPLVEISGAEADAASQLAKIEASQPDPDPTRVVRPPSTLWRDCRMCGRKISAPRRRRFRGSAKSPRGFACDVCSNLFCAAHVVRVSGLLETVFRSGRFRCQLCQLERDK